MSKPEITKDIYIEELVNHYPFTVRYLAKKGIKCIACGEPIWGTLGEAAREKGFDDAAVSDMITEMKEEARRQS